MANIIKRIWNQNKMVNIEALQGMAFQAEDGGHTFEISGVDDEGNAVPLSGTVAGAFMRPDKADIALVGTASDGVVSVTLSDACYAVTGKFGLTIFVTDGNNKKTAVYAAVGTVVSTTGGAVAGDTPQDVVDLINAIEAAVATIPASYTDMMAAIAPTYSSSALYAVGSYAWYDGKLYRCTTPITTAETWTAAHWEANTLGNGIVETNNLLSYLSEDVSPLTSPTDFDWASLGSITISGVDYETGWRNGYWNASTGAFANSYYFLCSLDGVSFNKDVKYAYAFAPEGYGIRVNVYNSGGTMIDHFGATSQTNKTRMLHFPVNPEYLYKFTVGRFDQNDSLTYNTPEFISGIRLISIKDTIQEIKTVLDLITVDSNFDWSEFGTESYPTGWEPGYYSTTGEAKSSYLYLRTVGGISASANMCALNASCPDGYGISVSEFGENGTYIGRYGASSGNTLTQNVSVEMTQGHVYKFNIGRFSNGDSPNYNNDTFLSGVLLTIKTLKSGVSNKKARTGEFEFFTVDVERPLSFGGEDVVTSTETIECVLRLPTSYSAGGTPTRLVLACHGSSGYINSATSTWYNANWKSFMDSLLSAGYAVFDANIFPTSAGTSVMGLAYGSPLYVNVLKKAYDYIEENYNVHPQIFAHGTSMGGVGASAFVNAYPELVLAESSFAGRDVTQYIYQIQTNSGSAVDATFPPAFGYSDNAALAADHFSHVIGAYPSLSLLRYNDGVLLYPPDRETSYADWLAYYGEVHSHEQGDPIGQYVAHRAVPYKTWDSWADNEGYTQAKLILQKAFTVGGSAPYLCVIYDNATHTDLSYGQGEYIGMRDQLISWYKRWE